MHIDQRIKNFLLCLLFPPLVGFAQQKNYVEIKATVFVEDGKLEGTTLDIDVNEKDTYHFEISQDTKFVYPLKFNNEYKLTFSKPGLYTRIILISTLVPKAILDVNSEFPPVEFQVNLFKEIGGVDKSFSLRPYARIFYDKAIDDFDYEVFMSDNMFAFQLDQAFALEKKVNKEQKALDKLELQDLKEMEKEFERIIREADDSFDQTRYDEALAKYKEANKLFPERPYPLDRIREIQNVLDALTLAGQKKQNLNKQYEEAIDRADVKYQEKIYDEALVIYREAMQYKPGDTYARDRIDEIEQLLAQQEKERKFTETLAQAENLFSNKEYQQAREVYREAAGILPDDPRPNARIEETDRILRSIAEQAAKEENYRQFMQEGDRLSGQQKYPEAVAEYRKAMDIKPEDVPAQEKIRNAEAVMKQREDQQAYDAAIAEADKAFRKKEYETAEAGYNRALEVKPQESYPQEQIDRIRDILATAEAERLKNQQYDSLIRSGDSLLNMKDLEKAKTAFTRALELSPGQNHPTRMILQIDREQEVLAAKEARRQQIEQSYKQAILKADQAFVDKQYEEAQQAYNEALGFKPEESYPSEQIEETDRILRSIAEQAAKEENYRQFIQEGDRFSGQQKYPDAIAEYRKALDIKPEDVSAQEKIRNAEAAMKQWEDQQAYDAAIAEADQAFRKKEYETAEAGYNRALEVKPQEKYPQEQIDRIRDLLATAEAERLKNQQYDSLIRSGDSLLNMKDLEKAKTAFTRALELSPGQNHPTRMILQIDREQEVLAAKEARRQQIEQSYKQAISKADQAFGDKQYEEAQQAYNEALGFKPEEGYPSEQIKKIDNTLDELRLQAEAARQQAIRDSISRGKEQNYRLLFQEAERLASGKKYEDAIAKLNDALDVLPDKRSEVNIRISEIKDLMRIAEEQLVDYREVIAQADVLYNSGKYIEARPLYINAGNIMPDEEYPGKQLKNIQTVLKAKDAEYAVIIARADEYFKQEKWQSAKNNYTNALTIKPDDEYATAQLYKVNQQMSRIVAAEVEESSTKKAYNDMLKQAEESFAAGKLNEARHLFEVSKTLRGGHKLSGSDDQRN